MEWPVIPEPYRIKMVEQIHLLSREERARALQEANFNLFQIPAENVYIDLLTDSGTGAMSANQWSALMNGDESYACARSFYDLRDAVEELFGFPFVLPTHQGRGAERVLFTTEVQKDQIVPSNAHFDTTRGNLEWIGAHPVDLPADCANNPYVDCSFKGNMDTARLEQLLRERGEDVPLVLLTVTNNRAAGQPVSMGNVKRVSEICKQYGKPLILDACRHAENAFFIHQRDRKFQRAEITEITREFFSYADGMFMSAKKDGLCNIGGFIAVRDEALYQRLNGTLILTEGFSTYGGLAGRDLAAMAVGLREAMQEDYLRHRIGQIEFLGNELQERGIPVYRPLGGHAVYVDASGFFINSPRFLPGQALAVSLYLEGGIRSCDIGSGMFSETQSSWNGTGLHLELLRIAIPRRVYTESHLRYVADTFAIVQENIQEIPSFECTYKSKFLGHFTAHYLPTFELRPLCG
jgi:tryptophanase